MLPILRQYIVETASPEMCDALTDAHAALERVRLAGYDERFASLLMTNETRDAGSTLIAISELTNDFLRMVLLEHGITLSDETSTVLYTTFVNGLMDLQAYENANDILDCIQDGVQPEETLSQMLELVSPFFVETFLEVIEYVNPYCIRRIRGFLNERDRNGDTQDQQPPVAVQEATRSLRLFYEFLERKDLITMQLLRGGLRVGFPFSVYIKTYGHDLETLEPKRAAEELIAMALISGDAQSNPRAAAAEVIDDFVSSLDRITAIDSAMKDILLRFQRV